MSKDIWDLKDSYLSFCPKPRRVDERRRIISLINEFGQKVLRHKDRFNTKTGGQEDIIFIATLRFTD